MIRPIDNYFLQQSEPAKSCLQFLRDHILKLNADLTEKWKYGMPVYCYQGRMFCYLWTHKKYLRPYIGIVKGNLLEHPGLLVEKRAKMKILLVDPNEDLDLEQIDLILNTALALYR